MLTLFVVLLITLASLAAMLWAGTYFFQGYIYTEPSPGIAWQAPAAAGLLTFGFAVWCFTIAFWTGASPTNLPIDTLFRFTPKQDMVAKPIDRIWAIKQDSKKEGAEKEEKRIAYVREQKWIGGRLEYTYQEPNQGPQWNAQDVVAIEIDKDGNKLRFDADKEGVFVTSDGWIMQEDRYGRPTGIPVKSFYGRLILNFLFNIAHFVGWFLGLWLLLRFQWTHALGLAVVLWVVATLILLPMLLEEAGKVAQARQVQTALMWIASPVG